MSRLFFLIFSIAGSTGAGAGFVAGLILSPNNLGLLLASAAIGAGLGGVASWMISRRLEAL
ncbi:MAG: hypothetical protein ACXIU7_04760 [Roseinatronobacter sp.]